ncbi:MAG: ankyrin repeat domain-containing protein [Spirochaetaceae bacterium]|nr:ankyrin repeat domain-containing protein [Spirochaetaceae bacterium]
MIDREPTICYVFDTSNEVGRVRYRRRLEFALAVLLCAAALPVAAQDCDGWNTPGFFAQDKPPVHECLLAGADVLARDESGWTPLHFAAALDDASIVGLLLEYGADVWARDDNDWTPVHFAAARDGDASVIDVLVDHGADVSARDDKGWTPLHWAAWQGSNPDTITALTRAGAAVEARSRDGWTPLHLAAHGNGPDIICTLTGAGADVGAQDLNLWTPLHWAAYGNADASVITLLAQYADVNARDGSDWTPLHWAALNNKEPGIIHALQQAGAHLETRDYLRGWTPLHLAAVWKNPEAFGALLAAEAGENTRDMERKTAWDYIADEDLQAYRAMASRSPASVEPNDSQPFKTCSDVLQ